MFKALFVLNYLNVHSLFQYTTEGSRFLLALWEKALPRRRLGHRGEVCADC
jgi:hypothetical protein